MYGAAFSMVEARSHSCVWGRVKIYYFVSASLEYIQMSNAIKYNVMSEQSAAVQRPKKDTLTTGEEARKFASMIIHVKEAVKSVDSRYLDQQQKERDTVRSSIRIPSWSRSP
jgi:hypothetical protein